MAGERELNAVYLVEASAPALIEAGPGADHDRIVAALDHLGVRPDDLAHIVVTHIHMDHAGGVGALLERYPRATRGSMRSAPATSSIRSGWWRAPRAPTERVGCAGCTAR